ncbi:MAG: response regulator [Chloroflexota bacterium]|nr:response regulator [Chloroflexota bacterium]
MTTIEKYVLVVDDEEDIRDFLTMSLSDEGYEVITAPHGAAALQQARQRPPQLILLDMRMPVMDGWEFSRAYREAPLPHAPIIVLTAATDAAKFARQIQANGFLPKPFNLKELLKLVRQYMSIDRTQVTQYPTMPTGRT